MTSVQLHSLRTALKAQRLPLPTPNCKDGRHLQVLSNASVEGATSPHCVRGQGTGDDAVH
eukprot:5873476-Prymnesium_polylepis.1